MPHGCANRFCHLMTSDDLSQPSTHSHTTSTHIRTHVEPETSTTAVPNRYNLYPSKRTRICSHPRPPSSLPFDYAQTTSNLVQIDGQERKEGIRSEIYRCEDRHMGKSESKNCSISYNTTTAHDAHSSGHRLVPTPHPHAPPSSVRENEYLRAVYVRQNPADDSHGSPVPKARSYEPSTHPTTPPHSTTSRVCANEPSRVLHPPQLGGWVSGVPIPEDPPTRVFYASHTSPLISTEYTANRNPGLGWLSIASGKGALSSRPLFWGHSHDRS
jgi:hypothetical protein